MGALMFNRIRISTTLFLILILCGSCRLAVTACLLGISRRFATTESGRAERSATCGISANSGGNVQAGTALNKAGTLRRLRYPADDIKTLMTTARAV
ncbi:Tar ligand binding domain-containing protein [Escherichia coli]